MYQKFYGTQNDKLYSLVNQNLVRAALLIFRNGHWLEIFISLHLKHSYSLCNPCITFMQSLTWQLYFQNNRDLILFSFLTMQSFNIGC